MPNRLIGVYFAVAKRWPGGNDMGHFSRCMCDPPKPGVCCYIERIIRIAEALEKNPGSLEPADQKLADRIFDSSAQLTDEQLSALEHSLFPD